MSARIVGVIAASVALSTAAFAAGAALHSAEPSKVAFEADGPAGMKINGESTGVKLEEKGDDVTVTAPTTTFDTGISLRNKHLKKALEAEKFPSAKFVVPKAQIKVPSGAESVDAQTKGTLTLHGETKPVDVKYSAKRNGAVMDVKATFTVHLADFKIEKPCYLGVCVGETVKVSVALVAHDD